MTGTNPETALWTGQDMADAMEARPVGDVPDCVTGISIDSRTLQPGEAFFAIKGDRFDGHSYATAAAAAGASVLVVSETKLPALGRLTVPLLVVSDVLEGLRLLARAARARSKARLIAVTGSAGKTTTKDALAHVLSRQGKTHAAAASFTNHWGVPLTLARVPEDARYGVFEIGMNHHGEITPLVKLVRPHVAMVTLIAAAHLGHFTDLDDIAKAKAEIFSGLVSGGTALINNDSAFFETLAAHARSAGVEEIAGYGTAQMAGTRILNSDCRADGSTATIDVFSEKVTVQTALPGDHVLLNLTGVLAAVSLVGGDVERAAHDLAGLDASPGRGGQIKLNIDGGTAVLIDESYNANPASMEAVLKTLAVMEPEAGGRRIAALGDMLEMGDHSETVHGALADPVCAAGLDQLHLCGSEMTVLRDMLGGRHDAPPVTHHDSVDALIETLRKDLRNGDVLLVKSSNGIGFSRIVKHLREAYPPAVG